MEVHKHPHDVTHKKKWGEYLLEFLMLFLAVFLGFIAENLREERVEQHREKQYLQSMLEDLKSDTAKIFKLIRENDSTQLKIDSLIHMLRSPDLNLHGNTIYYFARIITVGVSWRYELNDRTYEQMKSAGLLRLITDKTVSDSVSTYYSTQSIFKQQEELQLARVNSYFDFAGKIFDGAVFQEMMERFPYTYHRPKGNPQLVTRDASIINEYITKLHYFGGVMSINCSRARQQKDFTVRLIQLIQSNYQLD